MTSNEQIQTQPRSNILQLSVDKQSLRQIAIASLLASAVCFTGCQQLGFRTRGDEISKMISEQDDWALPQSPQSRVPRPSVSEVRSQSRRERSSDSVAETHNAKGEGNSRQSQPSVVDYGPARDEVNASGRSSLLTSPNQEIDVDGALATLPAAYREILKKQLDAVQNQSESIGANGATHVKKQSSENRSISDSNLQTAASANQPAEQSSNANAKDDSSIVATNETGSKKVSIRMSDLVAEDRDVVLATSIQPKANEATPSLAVATESPGVAPLILPTSSIAQGSNASSVAAVSQQPVLSLSPGNASLPSTSSSWRQLLAQAIEQLEKQVKETSPSDENLRVSQEVTLRMLYVSQRRLDDALRPIDKLSEHEQEYFRHQMQALYEAGNPDAMPVRSRHWSLVMNSQREATNQLAAASNLEVKSVAFCTEVERYGVMTKFPKYQFQPDQELLLYCEIENVSAKKVKEGFESQLQGSYEIIDSQGRKVADQLLPMEPEICQNHRRDYFIVYKIFMPLQMVTGNYQLRLTIEDMKARKFGQSQLDFQIRK